MKRGILFGGMLLVAFAGLALSGPVGYAERPSAAPGTTDYTLSWHTVDGGGGVHLVGGAYGQNGTIGEFDAGRAVGGSYAVNGGFWVPVNWSNYSLHLPLILK